MRRFTAGLALTAGVVTLLVLPLGSTGATTPKLVDQLQDGVNQTLTNVNDVVARLREEARKRREREAARRRAAAAPRASAPDAQGQGYTPPLHGSNPHGQGTPATVDLPASSLRPMPANPAGGNGEILVAGRSRGEQNPDGTFHGHITIASLFGNDLVNVNTTPGQTKAGPLDAVQQGLLNPLCDATSKQICLAVLTADSSTNSAGSTNHFAVANAQVGGPTGITAKAADSNGNISQDASCQSALGNSTVTGATIGTFTADVIQASSHSKECKDGTQTQTNTSKVVNLGNAGVTLPPLIPTGCGNGTPNTAALIPLLLPAVCNANDSNGAQAGAPYGVREGLTTFALAVNNGANALLKATTAAGESRAVRKAQCSDGTDNDGDGKIDFPADPGCSGPTDDDEADNKTECNDGVDNDGDGKIDFPADPGCSSARDNSEADSGNKGGGGGGKAECEDGKDNDGDGKIDFPDDPGCSSASDDSEANGSGTAGAGAGGNAAECNDGVDNDGDGKIDFPNDPGCSSESDDSEGGGNGLAFTGTNLLLTFLIGSLVLLAGLGLRALTSRSTRRRTRPV